MTPRLTAAAFIPANPGPEPRTGEDCGPYALLDIGAAFGFTTIGAGIERLPPGSKSSQRHWHSDEDEFVYVLAGTVILVEDTETVLHPGDIAGWRAGSPTAHRLENRGIATATYLVAGTRAARDRVTYVDHGLVKIDPRGDTRWEAVPE